MSLEASAQGAQPSCEAQDVRLATTGDILCFEEAAGCHEMMSVLALHIGAESVLLAMVGSEDNRLHVFHPPAAATDVAAKMLFQTCQAVDLDELQPFTWRSGASDSGSAILLMPLRVTPEGHRFLIAAYFTFISQERIRKAEQSFQHYRGFLSAYLVLLESKHRQQSELAAMEAMLNLNGIGILLLKRNAQIAFANRAADILLSQDDGIARRRGALRATDLADEINLQAALSSIEMKASRLDRSRSGSASPLLSFRRRKGPSLIGALMPASVENRAGKLALLYIIDPTLDPQSVLGPLCRLHGLTPVETTLVCNIVAGHTVSSAAEKMKIKAQTARSYLKQVYIKTGTHRQAELVVLLLSSVIRIPSGMGYQAMPSIESERALSNYI